MTRELGGQLRDDWQDWVNWTYWHILAYLGISWHFLASWRSNLELLSSWVGPEVRVPTAWYTVRGTGLPINVTFLAWSTLLTCFFSSCHFAVPNTNSDCTWLYIIRWLMMVVSCYVHLVKSPCRWLRILQAFPAPILLVPIWLAISHWQEKWRTKGFEVHPDQQTRGPCCVEVD